MVSDQNKKVSVIIRTKDRPNFLRRALSSIAAQDYPYIECIVINDGGISVSDVVAEFSFLTINYIELTKNVGRSRAANLAINAAKGDWISFLDDDDIYYPNHLSTLVSAFKPEAPIVYTDALKAIQAQSKDSTKYETKEFFLEYTVEHSFKRMLEGNFIPFQCLLFDSQILKQNLLDETLTVLEDWDLLIRISANHKFTHIKRITSEYSYRLDKTNTTGNNEHIWDAARTYLNSKHQEHVKSFNLGYIPTK